VRTPDIVPASLRGAKLGSLFPLTLRALRVIRQTSRTLYGQGLYEAYRLAIDTPLAERAVPMSRALEAFLRAENAWAYRSAPQDCLPRSLALFRFLLKSGQRADHVIGVRGSPFSAHAWVEVNGARLFDGQDRNFTAIARIVRQ